MVNKSGRNEQRKLSAAFVNGVGIAIAAIGGLTPAMVAMQNAALGQPTLPLFYIALATLVCFSASITLHWMGRQLLARIEE